ncbi:uncharacterized protein LOC134829183, partial [Culicoides brevitarsis]|uniref:uncharacterized protein LOC134829183 n=1 Tax=Culicoides brevitarsis TaxID=469753 RepID=UPI00307CBA01
MKIFRWIFLLLHVALVKGTSLVEDILGLKLDGDSVVSMDCKKTLKKVQRAFVEDEIWTIKLIDSSGRIASDFVAGNNYWLGSKDACYGVNQQLSLRDMSLSNRYSRFNDANLTYAKAPFEFLYYVTYVEHHSPYQLEHKMFKDNILHLGTCLPKICSNADVTELINEVLDENFDQYRIIGKKFTVLHTKTIDSSLRSVSTRFTFITLVIISTICVLLTIFCTLFSAKIKNLRHIPPILGDISDCFSLKQNLKSIFQYDEELDPLRLVIHGVRALTTLYLVLAHIGYFSIYVMDNSREGLKHVNDIEFFPFVIGQVVIENFFAMSGFLMGLGMISVTHKSSIKLLFQGIFIRILRLMIPYVPALLIFMSLASYFEKSSPYMTFMNDSYNCEHYWYRNVLFINNLFPFEEICYVTTWYISADFQLFVTVLA